MHPAVFSSLYTCELYRLPAAVAVVVPDAWKNTAPAERELLGRILQSVNLSLHHVRILSQPQLNVATLPVRPQQLLAFTTAPPGAPLYEMISTPACAMVIAEPLNQLLNHDQRKKQLWLALKAMFGL
jgi:DNA polymerase III psi subunit